MPLRPFGQAERIIKHKQGAIHIACRHPAKSRAGICAREAGFDLRKPVLTCGQPRFSSMPARTPQLFKSKQPSHPIPKHSSSSAFSTHSSVSGFMQYPALLKNFRDERVVHLPSLRDVLGGTDNKVQWKPMPNLA